MAGYPRKLLSLELPLKNIIKELKKDEIKKITGKSESHFRKCTDEGDLDHNIHHSDSVKLDLEFRRRKLGSPMLEAHESLLEAAALKLGKLDNTSNTLIDISAKIGRLMEATKDAIDVESVDEKLFASELESSSKCPIFDISNFQPIALNLLHEYLLKDYISNENMR